jgi:hypothetical protein
VKDQDALLLRENTGTTGLEQTARAAASALADHDIPHLVIDGLAVQEHGYPRVTLDVDMIVPDVLEAVEFLTADLSSPFARVPNCQDRVKDTRNGVLVDLLPAGKVVKRGCVVPFPQPTKVADRPQIIGLPELISLNLDSWGASPLRRLKDKADVVELIARRKLARGLGVAPAVRGRYLEIWDGLKAES